MNIFNYLQSRVTEALASMNGYSIDADTVLVQPTKKEFEGEYTVVTFPFVKVLKQSPDAIAEALGAYLKSNDPLIADFNVVKGFLNLSLSEAYWNQALEEISTDLRGDTASLEKIMVEFSSPNTNKPLHLGHVRNILLGWSMSRIFESLGHQVFRVQIINDRGIAICKSMLAWQKYADGATPERTGTKPDHFVGQWYVKFEQEFRKEYRAWQTSADGEKAYSEHAGELTQAEFFKKFKNTYFNTISPLGREARNMLLQWEANDPGIRTLWSQLNEWVYRGFDHTYHRMGVSFDRLYYESETYLLGKELVQEGLEQGLFYKKDDGSVWVDLEHAGLDQKILLRSDGTSVYITQDLGTAQLRYDDFGTERMIYVVADEQNYHFRVLIETLRLLKTPYADGLHHLAYGMVDLPSGRMKSRDGPVVDADDLMDEVFSEAQKAAAERGEITDLTSEEQNEIIERISLAALKYFIIKVDAKRRMTFDPAESVDMQGQTGPYIQNAYVRVRSILRKAASSGQADEEGEYSLVQAERDLVALLGTYGDVVRLAAEQYNPGQIANYCYQLAKDFHRYYHDYRILNAKTAGARAERLKLITKVAEVLHAGMDLLGIEMPERM